MNDDDPRAKRAFVAIYDRPAWWRRRRTWLLALPVLAALAALALFVWVLP